MSGTLSNVDMRKIYLSLKNDPDIINAHSQNDPNLLLLPLDKHIEFYANKQQPVDISQSLLDLRGPSPNIQQILNNGHSVEAIVDEIGVTLHF